MISPTKPNDSNETLFSMFVRKVTFHTVYNLSTAPTTRINIPTLFKFFTYGWRLKSLLSATETYFVKFIYTQTRFISSYNKWCKYTEKIDYFSLSDDAQMVQCVKCDILRISIRTNLNYTCKFLMYTPYIMTIQITETSIEISIHSRWS